MKTNNSSRKKRLLALLLSALMGSSVVALAACNGDTSSDSSNSSTTSSSSSSTEEEKSEEEKSYLIQNPDFATVSDDNLKYFSTSTTSWTRAVNSASTGTAQSSKSASGIIDTSDQAWTSLTTKTTGVDTTNLTEAQAKEQWNSLTLKDKLAYYEAWEDNNTDKNKKLSDLDFYQSVTIDEDDIKGFAEIDNPRTWDYSVEEAAKTDYDSHVLMIHNDYDTASSHMQGTAQKYTSTSTVTVAAGTSMELSLWVKTVDLRCATTDNREDGQEPVDKGAYIRLTHTVGNQQLQPLEIKNINTGSVQENNGWKQYTFYLNGSSFADTTFTLVLGLGQGGGNDVNEYVNGYAFFDDIQCKPMNAASYDAATAVLTENEVFTLEHTEAKQKTVNAFKDDSAKFALDFSGSAFVVSDYLNNPFSFEYTTETNTTGGNFTAVATPADGIAKPGNKKPTSLGAAINGTYDVAKVFTNPAEMANGNRYLQAAYNNYLLGKDQAESKFYTSLGENKATLMLFSAEGAALTANNTYTLSMQANEYLAFSFFVKTSEMDEAAGATVTLKDDKGNTLATIASIDSTTATPVAVDGDEDVYDGWQQCFFFISAEKDANLHLTFQLGPTTVIGTTQDAYKPGFAAFAGFKTYNFKNGETVLEEEFKLAKEGTYSKVVTVKDTENTNNDNFDSVSAVSPTNQTIENGYANPKNYKLYVGGDKIVKANETTSPITTAGLLNQKHAETYYTNGILAQLGATAATATEAWNEVFDGGLLGTANQPLVIYNTEYASKSYGFVGSNKTVAANSYQAVSMRIKVSAGSKAYVYLIDTDDDSFNKTLSVSRSITYWYDDDGNVCASDPTASDFQDKDIALLREENGLYTVNQAWWKTVSDAPVPTGYYANLQAYGTPVGTTQKNLLLEEGFTPYNYNGKWQHDGNDGIAFYDYTETTAENGRILRTAYAESNKRNSVQDFANLAELPTRFAAETAKDLYFEIDGTATNGEWADVTFFIKTGETAKNYRLEIWSGARNNAKTEGMPQNAYVIVDSRNIGTLNETVFNDNLNAREDDATDSFKSVFSFFDTAKFLRYNKEMDSNNVGNSYDNYAQSAKTEGIAYLTYQTENKFETYVDFTLSESPVSTDPAEDEDDTQDDTTESNVNIWLLASSITIAAVLVLAVISLIIRKAFKSARKKRNHTPTNVNKK